MSSLVIDASVVVRALLPADRAEKERDRALALWTLASAGDLDVRQPPHWLAEVSGVLACLTEATVRDDVRDLHALALPVENSLEMYSLATDIALELRHHLFDTLYHATALTMPDGLLVTADARYYRKASALGGSVLLADFTLELP